MNIELLFKNNKKWVAKKLALDNNYFKNLSKDQNPGLLYIGCSDSRVPAEVLMGVEPGEVFVHRNIANLVSISDLNVMSVLNFAIDQLSISHIVVCGHYYCGGIEAALKVEDSGAINPWLNKIREVYKIHSEELNSISSEDKKQKRLVELNVLEQCKNILSSEVVQNKSNKRNIKVYGWVFDIKTGKLIDLKINS